MDSETSEYILSGAFYRIEFNKPSEKWWAYKKVRSFRKLAFPYIIPYIKKWVKITLKRL